MASWKSGNAGGVRDKVAAIGVRPGKAVARGCWPWEHAGIQWDDVTTPWRGGVLHFGLDARERERQAGRGGGHRWLQAARKRDEAARLGSVRNGQRSDKTTQWRSLGLGGARYRPAQNLGCHGV
jgi:hypothetical protein